MLTRLLGSRGLMSAATVLVFVLAAALGLTLTRSGPPVRGYCAEMPDSIGLYPGSAVTIMGVPVGRVTTIEPGGATALVRFTVRADRKLPPDVGAVTVSDTLVADRKLALIGDEPGGPARDSGRCITRTLTPKSLSQTFDALARLSAQLGGDADPAQRNAFGAGLDALDRATAGSGGQLNETITALARALNSPDAAIGHLGALIDALAELAHRARDSWPAVQDSITGLTQAFGDINVIAIPEIVRIVANLTETLPQLNDVITMFGSPILHDLDAMTDLPRLIDAGVGSLAEVIRMAPAVATGFAGAIDPATGRLTIGYAPPKLTLPQQDATQLCAALATLTGGPCPAADNGTVTIPQLLGAVSAR
ncbi:MlaD family protein [Nocardia aurantia]|uniref:Mce/MlaD domain-containing protein n=1 Tax=Nocardia aurantia TaxID=2585199 RepID=A0A7K0DJD3_9NOCA|nr:MlaD family protein [Nocardia aurantia]MQY25920.1 hypothetical protein [Nocardia aurantia]